ncbi:Autoinducer 2 sensor kinase/phosphatase LuxQ [Planctomycetes bacterium Poly30]|uniref:histidine kinase n=1 Tax=Saltatorellus ferox TaxID=2528018 RepID=A0A518EV29_9BACT|nr:Autoinducer 2 sensor kinase/phosphatase LuxQ [Planctomycetes bacterium Poly30]
MWRFRTHYLFALGALAVLNLGSLVLIQEMFRAAHADSKHINVAGRQRMLSQRITKSALALDWDPASSAELKTALEEFEAAHEQLVRTTADEHPVHAHLSGLEATFQALLSAGHAVLEGRGRSAAEELHAAAGEFLPKMHAAVNAYEKESQDTAARARSKEIALLIATLLVLIAEGLFIFEPLCKRLVRDERTLENARDEAIESADMRKRFLATVSHEIRTPLHGVLGTSALVLQTDLTEEQASLVNAGKRSAENILAMLNGVLDHAKIQEGALALESKPFSLVDLIEDLRLTRHSPYRRAPVELVVERSDRTPDWLLGDVVRIRQLLLNLVSNALKFTLEGEVRVTLDWTEASGGGRLLAEVLDTGIGIPEDRLESIFEEFTQAEASTSREYGGTGLGLSISRDLARLMGGAIELASAPGEGSRFTVRIPLDAGAKPLMSDEDPGGEGVQPGSQIRVLAADDDQVNRRILEAHLRSLTGSFCIVENGRLAVDEARNRVFDVVLLDLNMPVMGGRAAARALRERSASSDALIVAITGETGDEVGNLCQETEFDVVLAKPFKKAELKAILEGFLTHSRAKGRAA